MKKKIILLTAAAILAMSATQVQAANLETAPRFYPFFRISKFGSREYQHLQCEKKALRNPTKTIIFATETKGRSHESHSKQRGLQIPILGASELQIRWNGSIHFCIYNLPS